MRGDGRIFRQKGSPYLWISYYCRGKEHRESAKSTDREIAVKLLRRRLKEVGADQVGARRFLGPRAERIPMAELFDALETAKKNNQRLVPSEMVRLREYWKGWRALEVTGAAVERWKSEMLDEGLAPKTIRNYCQLLGEAFRVSMEDGLIAYAPTIKRVQVPENARDGKFSRAEFEKVKALLPEYLRDFAEWAYHTGWRAGAIRSLRWEDIHDHVLTVRAQYSKNRHAQDIPLVGPLAQVIERRSADRNGAFVFHYPDNKPRHGDRGHPIGSYKTAWKNALCKAGLSDRIFHDLRRTAVTELNRAGVPEVVAMRITGHATNAIHKRYRIVDDSDVKKALAQRAEYEAAQLKEAQRKAAEEAATAAQRAAEEAARLAQAAAISGRIQ